MSVCNFDIDELIVHRDTMSLLDRVVSSDESSLQSVATVSEDNPFVLEQGLPAWVGIEYMAQSVAAYAGVGAKKLGEAAKIGFLVGTRKYQCTGPLFALGSELQISVRELLMGDNGLGAFECEIRGQAPDGSDVIASANLNVFQPDNIDDILSED